MYHAFRFRPEAVKIATKEGLSKGLIYLSTLFVVLAALFLTERKFPEEFGPLHIYLLITFFFLTLASVYSARQRAKTSGLFLNPEGVQFTLNTIELNVPYKDITKVQLRSDSTIMIYTGVSQNRPVLTLSNLDKQEQFLSIISQFAPVVQDDELPVFLKPAVRTAFFSAFLLLLLTNLLFHSVPVVLITGGLFFTLMIYNLTVFYRYRKQISSPMYVIAQLFLILAIVYRTLMVVVPALNIF
jgi:hypothetical protein